MLTAEQKETPYNSVKLLYAGWMQKREKAQGKRYTNNVKYICYVMLCILYLKSMHKIVYDKKLINIDCLNW